MAGAGYKLFNTGDVLTAAQVNTYLQEQVVMVFNDATARTTALSGVLAEGMISYLKSDDTVYLYNGSAWVSIAADQTPLTTKGDLFTFSTVDARLGVGSNGQTLFADSAATTGLRWQDAKTGNSVLNSAFQVWQRGTSVAVTASTYTYTADRWQFDSGNTATISRQSTNDTTNLPFIEYCARVQRNSGQTSTTNMHFHQPFETINSRAYAGKAVVLSFYARSGSNYSATSNLLRVQLTTGTGTDQNPRSGSYTGSATPIDSDVTLTTTWQRFSLTGTIASTATELDILFRYTPTGTAGANDFYEITGIQLEVGSVATAFAPMGLTYQEELAACQRYYYRNTDPTTASAIGTLGFADGTRYAYFQLPLPVVLRVAPTSFDFANLRVNDGVTSTNAASALVNYANPNYPEIRLDCTSGLTQFRPYRMMSQSATTGYFGFSAEL